jgi:hypothetical protein
MRNPVGQRWRQAAYDDERYAPITRHVSSSRSLSVLAARFAACPRWKDGEPATRHAQNDSRAVGVAAGRKPADVVGRAMFALQHGSFLNNSPGRYAAARLSDAPSSVPRISSQST